ncbi:hypothetical protein TWF718_001542 [Orbilia javanica]|uniref:Uncharacterized protein n=1 Tax=Orbilia javanica TaxID=47235 RepID=A0AAN8NE06_9PEZI
MNTNGRYRRQYSEPYIHGKTRIPNVILEQLATSFVDDYIENRCGDMGDSWANIRSPFALKRKIKKSYRSMMVLFAEIGNFKRSLSEPQNPSATLRLTFLQSEGRFLITSLSENPINNEKLVEPFVPMSHYMDSTPSKRKRRCLTPEFEEVAAAKALQMLQGHSSL